MWLEALLLLLTALVVAIAVVLRSGASRWQSGTRALQAKAHAARRGKGSEAYDPRELQGLPAPVQRYFRTVLQDGQPLVAAVSVEHTGTINLSATAERWKPFTSIQHVVARPPGFVWDARIRLAPGMTVFVQDAYVAGEGVLMAKLLGVLTVMVEPSTAELAQGELLRFLAEAAWYPTALLPSRAVRWEALDDGSARATLADAGTEVSLEFHFDEAGLLGTVRSSGRHRRVHGRQVPTPWQGRFWDYEPRHGMLVPLAGEVAWLLPGGPRPYWRGRIRSIQYEYAE